MESTRRRLLSGVGATAVGGLFAGCIGDTPESSRDGADTPTVRSSFFVFGDIAEAVAGDAATAELLVPVGQHGHGWKPGPRVRERIRDADLFVHGMEGFQPWADDVVTDLDADGADVATVDVSEAVDLLAAGDGGHAHDDGGEHGTSHDDEKPHDTEADPHFWMDPLRARSAVGAVRDALVDIDPVGADAYASNAETRRGRLDDLHEDLSATVADAGTRVILVAGHDSLRYAVDRYDIEVAALTDVSPDDRPTPRDIERAQTVVETHGLRYVCADPLESQQAAEQLVAETDAEAVLPLTAIPGLTEEWAANDWGYVDVMEQVNLPTLARALDAR